MPCIQLREELAKLGLDTDGKKAALVERLYAAHVASSDKIASIASKHMSAFLGTSGEASSVPCAVLNLMLLS